jgi:hypothetical protein
MKLYNPLTETVTVQIFGITYSIKGESTLDVDENVGKYWTTRLHQFIEEVKPDKEVKVTKEELKDKKK